MITFTLIIIAGSLFCAGWYARGLWDAIDEAQVARDKAVEQRLAQEIKDYWQERL